VPKQNPKRSSRYSQYYRRVKERAITETIKDRSSLYYGLTFAGIIVVVVVVVVALTLPSMNKIIAQRGDVVDIRYIGTYSTNGTIFDEGLLQDQTIGSNSLLQYFDQQLIGMEAGVVKNFVIPSEFGYTASTHELYGHDLAFQVTITKLTRATDVLYAE
jgi:hypothetical protein